MIDLIGEKDIFYSKMADQANFRYVFGHEGVHGQSWPSNSSSVVTLGVF